MLFNTYKIIIISAGIVLFGVLIGYKEPVRLGQIGESNNVIRSAWLYHNGITTFAYRIGLLSATTTPCAIRAPSATSTIIHASIDIRTATGSANLVEIAKSTDLYSTSTLLAQISLASGTFGTIVATGTLQTADNLIISPSSTVVVRWGKSYGETTPRGNCTFIFRVVS